MKKAIFLVLLATLTDAFVPSREGVLRSRPSALQMIVPIPVDLIDAPTASASIEVVRTAASASEGMIFPDTSISDLDGGGNLALLLFAYTFYQGLFTNGRPAEWVLPVIASIFNERNEQWFKDFEEGYDFLVPPLMEAVRCSIFLALGAAASKAWIDALESSFYGYSTAFCLALPAALLSLARPKPRSRASAELESDMMKDFREFAASRLVRVVGSSSVTSTLKEMRVTVEQFQKRSREGTSKLNLERDKNCARESSIILAFRRQYMRYRDETEVSDKEIRRVVRAVIGYKPLDGIYIDLKLQNLKRESREMNKQLVAQANRQREEALVSAGDAQGDADDDAGASTLGSDFIAR